MGILLISIEVAFIALSLTRKQNISVTQGGEMITWKGSGLGNALPIEPKWGRTVARNYRNSIKLSARTRLVHCFESEETPDQQIIKTDLMLISVAVDTPTNTITVQETKSGFEHLATPEVEFLQVPVFFGNTTSRRNMCESILCHQAKASIIRSKSFTGRVS